MTKAKLFETTEFAAFPATASGAKALGSQYYTGIQCNHGHLGLRYTSSGNCILCIAQKQGQIQIGKTNARSKKNYELAEQALANGASTYIPGSPCKHGHSLRFVGSGNCVECAKTSVEKMPNGYHRWLRIKKVYGITKEEFENFLASQGGLCAICERPLVDKKTHIDHCHDTGKVRGLLCGPCNQGLGLFQESKMTLSKALKYLEKFDE